jgi:hypothetical protein
MLLSSAVKALGIVTIIVVCVAYFRNYCPYDSLIFHDNFDHNLLNEHVHALQVLKVPLWNEKYMALTESTSHWFIVVHLKNDTKIQLSTSAYRSVYVKPFRERKRFIATKLYKPLTECTLYDVVKKECEYTHRMHYGYMLYNCQDSVRNTVKAITGVNLYIPERGINQIKAIYGELF